MRAKKKGFDVHCEQPHFETKIARGLVVIVFEPSLTHGSGVHEGSYSEVDGGPSCGLVSFRLEPRSQLLSDAAGSVLTRKELY
jgi:hypothetical protein